jgi:hypothetical protein
MCKSITGVLHVKCVKVVQMLSLGTHPNWPNKNMGEVRAQAHHRKREGMHFNPSFPYRQLF